MAKPFDSRVSQEWLGERVSESIVELEDTDDIEEMIAIVTFIAWAGTQMPVIDAAVTRAHDMVLEELNDPQLRTPRTLKQYDGILRSRVRSLRHAIEHPGEKGTSGL